MPMVWKSNILHKIAYCTVFQLLTEWVWNNEKKKKKEDLNNWRIIFSFFQFFFFAVDLSISPF